jgi:hypothetical protein
MKGLKQSNCIICFITKKYSQSVVCKRELSFALEKPHAILMLEHYNEIEDAVQFKIKIDSRLNFYWNKEKPSMWVGEEYEKLIKTISPYINISTSNKSYGEFRIRFNTEFHRILCIMVQEQHDRVVQLYYF